MKKFIRQVFNRFGYDLRRLHPKPAQGAEFSVLQSAGNRLRDIRKVTMEIFLTPELPYKGAVPRGEFIRFMRDHGFTQVAEEVEPSGRHGDFTFVRQDH